MSLLTTCFHSDDNPNFSLEKIDNRLKHKSPLESPLKNLDKILSHIPGSIHHVQDIRYMLQAKEAENANDLPEALKMWKKALISSSNSFAESAIKGWIQAYSKDLDQDIDNLVLSRLILQETKEGQESAYLVRHKLTNPESLTQALPFLLANTSFIEKEKILDPISPPQKKGIPAFDKLLVKTSKLFCKSSLKKSHQWRAWAESLPTLARIYWKGLSLECEDNIAAAIRVYKKISQFFPYSQTEDHPFIVASYQKLVKLLRANDARDEAPKYYKALMRAWKLSGNSHISFGIKEEEFAYLRVEDALWAARYRALIGDYQNAKKYIADALNILTQTKNKIKKLTQRISQRLASLKAEAYHVLAFRIAIEMQDYSRAASLAKMALQIPHLPKKWIKSQQWYYGLYEFLDGRLNYALETWKKLSLSTTDKMYKPRVLFWISYVYAQKGQIAESNKYLDQLGERYPLSFYHTTAPKLAKMQVSHPWENSFKSPARLEHRLEKMQILNNEEVRDHSIIGTKVLRLELLLAANLDSWASIAARDLYRFAIRRLSLAKNTSVFLHLSRLLYVANEYHAAIHLTNELAKINKNFWRENPEQIHILFPRAYAPLFKQKALENSLDPALLYAISRQESVFKKDAESNAKAIGLMQIIRPTARRMAVATFLEWNTIKDQLDKPDINVKLGSTYLKLLSLRYRSKLQASIAAYNAGEYAVDMWLRHRSHPSPLAWLEILPFQETRTYVQKVLRNKDIYKYLGSDREKVVFFRRSFFKRHASKKELGKKPRRSNSAQVHSKS